MRPYLAALLLVPLILLPGGCSTPSMPAIVQEPAPLQLTPLTVIDGQAEGAHANRIEWWYYNGHLQTSLATEPLGYHFTVFKLGSSGNVAGYVVHYSLTLPPGEHKQGFLTGRRVVTNSRGNECDTRIDEPYLALESANWCMAIGSGGHQFSLRPTANQPLRLDLHMRPTTAPLIHNRLGWFEYIGWSYYYSHPRMTTTGTLTLDAVQHAANGVSWFDHQWGDFIVVGAPAGWQWMALLLDDGSSLKVTVARDTYGEIALKYGTLQTPDGETVHIDANRFELQPSDHWTSPTTGAVYPSEWSLKIPDYAIDLRITPTVVDQEVTAVLPRAAIYWEGQVTFDGSSEGYGYVELAGYVEP